MSLRLKSDNQAKGRQTRERISQSITPARIAWRCFYLISVLVYPQNAFQGRGRTPGLYTTSGMSGDVPSGEISSLDFESAYYTEMKVAQALPPMIGFCHPNRPHASDIHQGARGEIVRASMTSIRSPVSLIHDENLG